MKRHPDETKMRQFLKELKELCDKHGAALGGCGCCGSPWAKIGVEYKDNVSVQPEAKD